MTTFTTTLLLLLLSSIYSYSQTTGSRNLSATTTPTATPSPTATPFRTASPTSTPFSSISPGGSPPGDFTIRMRQLDTQMDTIFGDAFRNAGDWFNRSSMASSVNLREQNNKYVARVYLPHFDTSTADVKINRNGVLHIVANGNTSVKDKTEAEHYEQSITLPNPVQSEKMKVQRKPDLLVITVPEQTAGSSAVASSKATPVPETSAATVDAWEDSISKAFARLNTEMDRALNETFPNNFAVGPHASELESAVKMDDQKDKYVVHFYLPEQNISNVKVNFENGKLRLTAEEEPNATPQPGGGGTAEFSGEYNAMISVPGSVNKNEIKVDRQANAVVVTLPKA